MSRAWLATLMLTLLIGGGACDWSPTVAARHWPATIGLLEDAGGSLDITQASSAGMAGRYVVENHNRMSMGFSRSAYWVRIPLERGPEAGDWVLEVAAPWLDQVDFYLPDGRGGWRVQSTGLQQPGADHSVGGFALHVPAGTPRDSDAYLRLKSVLSLNAGLRLLPEAGYARQTVVDGYVFGGLYGLIAAMIMVNLAVLVTTGDRTYLLYVLYLASIIAHQVCLQGQVLLAPAWVWPLVPGISILVSSFVFFFGASFCRMFLNTKTYAPVLDRVLLAAQGAALLLLVFALTGHIWWGTWLTHLMAILGPLAAIAAGLKALHWGFRPARFYLAAWAVLLLGAMAWGAWSMGWQLLLPLPRSTLTFAAALESILLSLALADRVGVMQRERQVLAQRERRYRQMSLTDELTGLSNSRYFWSKLETDIDQAHAQGQPLGLVLMDVDDFKRFNDTYGHTEGDIVLAELGRCIRNAVRPSDSACRYGGEEFALVLPGASAQVSYTVAERVRLDMAQIAFQPADGCRIVVTASMGTAQLSPGDTAKSLVRRADKALYQAKSKGKNRTSCDGE